MEESDIRLIRQAKAGDTEAFTLLVQNYKNYVMQTAAGILGDLAEAEDVVQETFVRAYFSLRQLRRVETFPSWIATIATRLAMDARKRRSRQTPQHPDPEVLSNVTSTANYADVENRMTVLKLLAELSEEERSVITLRELQDRTYQEMSELLDIPIGTVRSRLHHARRSLKRLLSSWERDDTHDHL